jgi:hypothetical protein
MDKLIINRGIRGSGTRVGVRPPEKTDMPLPTRRVRFSQFDRFARHDAYHDQEPEYVTAWMPDGLMIPTAANPQLDSRMLPGPSFSSNWNV